MNSSAEELKEKRPNALSKLLDPSKLIAGAVAAAVALVLQLFVPPLANSELESIQSWLVKGGAAVAVFLVTWRLEKERRTVLRVLAWSLATLVLVSGCLSAAFYWATVSDALAVHKNVTHWDEVLNDTFVQHQNFSTRGTDVNGSGNATTGGGILTLRLRSTHVANQQFRWANVAPAGQPYYVETSVRRQSGPFGSGCFLGFGVQDSNRYFLFEVTDDQRPDRPLHSAQIFQELSAAPPVEKAVDHTDSLSYVDYWSLLWPPGAYSQWTQLAISRSGANYQFYVDDRLVSTVTGLP